MTQFERMTSFFRGSGKTTPPTKSIGPPQGYGAPPAPGMGNLDALWGAPPAQEEAPRDERYAYDAMAPGLVTVEVSAILDVFRQKDATGKYVNHGYFLQVGTIDESRKGDLVGPFFASPGSQHGIAPGAPGDELENVVFDVGAGEMGNRVEEAQNILPVAFFEDEVPMLRLKLFRAEPTGVRFQSMGYTPPVHSKNGQVWDQPRQHWDVAPTALVGETLINPQDQRSTLFSVFTLTAAIPENISERTVVGAIICRLAGLPEAKARPPLAPQQQMERVLMMAPDRLRKIPGPVVEVFVHRIAGISEGSGGEMGGFHLEFFTFVLGQGDKEEGGRCTRDGRRTIERLRLQTHQTLVYEAAPDGSVHWRAKDLVGQAKREVVKRQYFRKDGDTGEVVDVMEEALEVPKVRQGPFFHKVDPLNHHFQNVPVERSAVVPVAGAGQHDSVCLKVKVVASGWFGESEVGSTDAITVHKLPENDTRPGPPFSFYRLYKEGKEKNIGSIVLAAHLIKPAEAGKKDAYVPFLGGNWCEDSVFYQHNTGPEYLEGPTMEKKAATIKPQCFTKRTRGLAMSGGMNEIVRLENVAEAQEIPGYGRHCEVDYRENTRAIEQVRHETANREMQALSNIDPNAEKADGSAITGGMVLNSQTYARPVDITGAVRMYHPLPESVWDPADQPPQLPLTEIHPAWVWNPGAGAVDGFMEYADVNGEKKPRTGILGVPRPVEIRKYSEDTNVRVGPMGQMSQDRCIMA